MEQKRLLEVKRRIKDQDFYKYIQKKDQDADDEEKKSKALYQKAKISYLKSLKDQMREQQQLKLS